MELTCRQPDARMLPSRQDMLLAFNTRDPEYDGVFFAAVKTTGIFCLPSCPARKPLPDHIEFFVTADEAISRGYRPCKRCRPMEKIDESPGWIKTLLESLELTPNRKWTDQQLRANGYDPVRVRRWFKIHYGVTFQGYQRSRRLATAHSMIKEGISLNAAKVKSGYRSDSAFRKAFVDNYGAAPKQINGTGVVVATSIDSPVGNLMLAANDTHLTALRFMNRTSFASQMDELRQQLREPVVAGENKIIRTAIKQLGEYFAGKRKTFDLPLQLAGTAFQRRTWEALLTVPYGKTISYGELAEMIDKPSAYRAVGNANGANRIAIIIPCHRVIATGGKLGGYGGELWRKEALLELEQTFK